MNSFKNIHFIVDDKMHCVSSFERAVQLVENNQAVLTVAAIVDKVPDNLPQLIDGVSPAELTEPVKDERLRQILTMLASQQDKLQIRIKYLTGKPFMAIIQEVLKHNRDLVIKTVDDETFMQRFFGSSDMSLLRKCPCPVWLLKASHKGHYKKILAAVDFDPILTEPEDEQFNQRLINISLALALSEFSELHIIHVWSAYGESSLRSGLGKHSEGDLNSYVEEIRAKHEAYLDKLITEVIGQVNKDAVNFIKPRVHLIKGNPRNKIPEIAKKEQIDLIVMGTVARSGVPGLLMGNTAEMILNQIDCSVLAVKPAGFISQVKAID